jgi:hypothetical protein
MSTPTFKAPILAAFNGAWLSAVGGGVTVVNGSNSTQGIRERRDEIEVGNGLEVTSGGTVKVKTDDIGTLVKGSAITVDGTRVFISEVRPDDAGALTYIDYTNTKAPTAEELL